MTVFLRDIRGVVWDWGDTLMRNLPGQEGPMADWPRVEAMPGAQDALVALSGLEVQCVATNAASSDGAAVARALDRVGLKAYFAHFLTFPDLGTKKPDPGFFQAVSDKLGIPPSELVSIGDKLHNDVLPAKAAGLTTVYVNPDPDPAAEGQVDLTVRSLTELAEVLRKELAPAGGMDWIRP